MDKEILKKRTKQFAIRIMNFAEALPRSRKGNTIANQIIRSGTSVGANYRSACRSRSTAEFISKLGVVLEEADETAYWLECATEAGVIPEKRVSLLLQEANELCAIMFSAQKTTRQNSRKSSILNSKSSLQ